MVLAVNKNKRKINKSKQYLIFLVVLFVSFVFFIVIFFALKSTGYKDVEYVVDNNLTKKLFYKVINEEEICLTQKEFNSILNNLLIGNNKLQEGIKSISVVPIGDEKYKIFVPYRYKNVDLEFSLKTALNFNKDNNQIELKVLETKLGCLPIPRDIILKNIENPYIAYKNNIIFIKKEKTVILFNKQINFRIVQFNSDNKNFFIKLKINNGNLKNSLIKAISDCLSTYLF